MNTLLNVLLVIAFGLSAIFITACAYGHLTAVNNNQSVNENQILIAGDNADGTTDPIENEAESSAKTIKVTVSGKGFTPEQVSVKKGHLVKLAFYRADADNCGSEVVFPKLNIKRALPVGKTVTVSFTPTGSGEIAFACGMNMMRGKVVVTD